MSNISVNTGASGEKKVLSAMTALLAILTSSLATNSLSIILVRAAATFRLEPERLAIISSVQFAGFFLITLTGGILAEKHGHRIILTVGCLFMLAGSAIWILALNLPLAYCAGTLLGLGSGIMASLAPALLSDLYPTRRKLVLNLSLTLFCISAFGGPAMMGWLMPMGISWRVLFVAIAALTLIMLPPCLFLPRKPKPVDHTVDLRENRGVWQAIAHLPFILPAAAIFCYVMAENCIVVFLNPYLRRVHHAPEQWAIYSISLFWFAMGFGRAMCSLIPERVSYEKAIGTLFFACAIAVALQGVVDSWQLSILFFVIAGLACSGTFSMLIGMNASRHPHHGAPIVTWTIAIGALGGMSAPPFMNSLFAIMPGKWVYVCASGLFALGAVLMVLAWHHGCRAVQEKEPADQQPALI